MRPVHLPLPHAGAKGRKSEKDRHRATQRSPRQGPLPGARQPTRTSTFKLRISSLGLPRDVDEENDASPTATTSASLAFDAIVPRPAAIAENSAVESSASSYAARRGSPDARRAVGHRTRVARMKSPVFLQLLVAGGTTLCERRRMLPRRCWPVRREIAASQTHAPRSALRARRRMHAGAGHHRRLAWSVRRPVRCLRSRPCPSRCPCPASAAGRPAGRAGRPDGRSSG
jgi:hypothetical protein